MSTATTTPAIVALLAPFWDSLYEQLDLLDISSLQEQEGKSVVLDFHWQKNPARSNLLSYFTEQSGWMLSVGLLVVHGTLLVDVIPHLLS